MKLILNINLPDLIDQGGLEITLNIRSAGQVEIISNMDLSENSTKDVLSSANIPLKGIDPDMKNVDY